jgi:hypothetical protein
MRGDRTRSALVLLAASLGLNSSPVYASTGSARGQTPKVVVQVETHRWIRLPGIRRVTSGTVAMEWRVWRPFYRLERQGVVPTVASGTSASLQLHTLTWTRAQLQLQIDVSWSNAGLSAPENQR